jgi:SAM-dependent methyltransferase
VSIERALLDVAKSYPIDWLAARRIADITRVAYQIRLALNGTAPSNVSICDIGGGVGLFGPGCAALGMKVAVIDDFEEHAWYWNGGGADLHRRYGVSVICRDVITLGVGDIDQRFDIVTTFDTMEHWHHSPKALFQQIRASLLRPGGRFILGAPNCVNLRKRITTAFGYNKWSGMDVWYEQEVFRGHVREPDVDDLRYIARDMKLRDVKISGRNWLGYRSRFRPVRVLTPLADHPLRLFPSLCSDLYLTGTV